MQEAEQEASPAAALSWGSSGRDGQRGRELKPPLGWGEWWRRAGRLGCGIWTWPPSLCLGLRRAPGAGRSEAGVAVWIHSFGRPMSAEDSLWRRKEWEGGGDMAERTDQVRKGGSPPPAVWCGAVARSIC